MQLAAVVNVCGTWGASVVKVLNLGAAETSGITEKERAGEQTHTRSEAAS